MVANTGGQMKRGRMQRDLQVYGITDFELAAGAHACTAFGQIDCAPVDIYGCVPCCDTDSDVLVELKSRKPTLRGCRHACHRNTWWVL